MKDTNKEGYLSQWAHELGFSEGAKIIADGVVIGRVDLREQKYNPDGSPVPFNTPRYYCPICNKQVLKLPLIYLKDGDYVVGGEFAFHCQDTHGLRHDQIDLAEHLGITRVMQMIAKKKPRKCYKNLLTECGFA